MYSFFKKMKTLALCAAISVSALSSLCGQALPIAIDGDFGDWASDAASLADPAGDGNNIDLLQLFLANDERYLFLRFELQEEVLLTDNNDLTLFLDTDNNPLTGKSVGGLGAELELNFGDREGEFYHGNSTWYLDFSDIDYHHLPTVTSSAFEMAIGRGAFPDGVNPLFTSNKIRLLFRDGVSGDYLPDAGNLLYYEFDNDPTQPFQPIDLDRDSPNLFRLATWNMLQDGISDIARKDHFQQVLSVLKPDVLTFNEAWDATVGQAVSFLNLSLPIGNFQSWQGVKLGDGNITLSRYPIVQSWEVFPGHRLIASLIDLPDNMSDHDLLVINAHLRCCDANYERQQEADAFVKFILDAKTPGGAIDLPEGTPFVLSGDLNLVGQRQQLTTLLTGDIQNNAAFGPDGLLDWDDTGLLDVVALQADQAMAFTWHEDGSQYPPSRIDYHICSNSVMEVKKAFTLNTRAMGEDRLQQYGLSEDDTQLASDHFPKVTDFDLFPGTSSLKEVGAKERPLRLSPNPLAASADLTVAWDNPSAGVVACQLKNMAGQVVGSTEAWFAAGPQSLRLAFNGLPAGIYMVELTTGGNRLLGRAAKI